MYGSKYDAQELIIAILLYFIPILVVAVRRNLLWQFKFSALTKVINLAFFIQMAEVIIIFIVGIIMDNINESSETNVFTELVGGTLYFFLTIGMMLYVPFLVILNIINWFKIKSKAVD